VDADAHAKFRVVLQRGLHLAGTVHCVECAVKTRERPIANLAEHSAVVFWEEVPKEIAMLGEGANCHVLVRGP